jgi:AraC-like DNA-binding protein
VLDLPLPTKNGNSLGMISTRNSMTKQVYFPRDAGTHNTAVIRLIGVDHPDETCLRQGNDWTRFQTCRYETFSLAALETYRVGSPDIGYTRQEDYVKVNFWLSGKHTTILDGYGQFTHDRPEVFITSGPCEMIKVDVLDPETHVAAVAVCLLREFFPTYMGLAAEELPEPLRTMVLPNEKPFAFHRFALTPDLLAATRAILAAPFTVRRQPIYAQAKAVELMCLLLDQIAWGTSDRRGAERLSIRHESRLYEARDILTRCYANEITLEKLSKAVGVNRMALTSGFKHLFGLSVHDFLHRIRMERAFELLQDPAHSILEVAEAVGYSHPSTFSTAFHCYFGCSPRHARTQS